MSESVGSGIRHKYLEWLWIQMTPTLIDLEMQFQSRSMSDPIFSDIEFKKWNGFGLDYA